MKKEFEREMTFGETIALLRVENGFTKKEVAEYVNCSQTYIADIEKKDKIPSDTIIVKLAELFKYNKKKLLFLAKRDATVPEAKDIFKIPDELFERELINDYFLTVMTFKTDKHLNKDALIMDKSRKAELSRKIFEKIDSKYPDVAGRPYFISKEADIKISEYLKLSQKSDKEIIEILISIIEKVEYDVKTKDVKVYLNSGISGNLKGNVEPANLGEMVSIPLLTWVQAGEMTGYDDKYPYPGCSDEYITTDLKGEHLFALRVKGDSMSPKFLEGDVVIINPDAHTDNGDFIIVKNEVNHETMLKQLKKYSNDLIILHPLNPSYSDVELSENYKIIGRVVRKQTNL
jgi:SOS-response transcriptional repressor LexA/DNA-binding XRE family transcriptional regulator